MKPGVITIFIFGSVSLFGMGLSKPFFNESTYRRRKEHTSREMQKNWVEKIEHTETHPPVKFVQLNEDEAEAMKGT